MATVMLHSVNLPI